MALDTNGFQDFIQPDIHLDKRFTFKNVEMFLSKIVPDTILPRAEVEIRAIGQFLEELSNVEAHIYQEGEDPVKIADVDTTHSFEGYWVFTVDFSSYELGDYGIIIKDSEKQYGDFALHIEEEPVIESVDPENYDITTDQDFEIEGQYLQYVKNGKVDIYDEAGNEKITKNLTYSDNKLHFSINADELSNADSDYTLKIYNSETQEVYSEDLTINTSVAEEFKFTIETTENFTQFRVPAFSYLTTNETTNLWLIDWGDGTTEELEVTSMIDHSHTYNNAGTYQIKITQADTTTTAWLSFFGFANPEETHPQAELVKSIDTPLTWKMTRTAINEAPKNEYYGMFATCTNLNFTSDSDFNLPQDITTVGNNFAGLLFYGCVSLTTLPNGFNLPQGITTIGYSFASSMFNECENLTALPTGFNLPQDIETIGISFATSMFEGCKNLTALPTGFNLPQGITTIGYSFATSMFEGCKNLTALPTGFTFPQNVETVEGNFALSMFKNCSTLATLSNDFNLPQNLETVGQNFAGNMFSGCSALTSLPNDFNLPQNIETVGSFFAMGMFKNCTNLTKLPDGFNFPQNLTTIESYFISEMFLGCEALAFLPTGFKFPVINPASARRTPCFAETFNGCIALTSAIADVITTNEEPIEANKTFTGCIAMSDYPTYEHSNWGDGIVPQEFKFKINTEVFGKKNSTSFTIPVRNNTTEVNYWLVNWGDGTPEEFCTIEARLYNGAEHDYEDYGEYTVTVRPATNLGVYNPEATAWLSRFGCRQAGDNYMITDVLSPLTWRMTRTAKDTPATKEYQNFFYGCRNLNFTANGKFNFPQDITVIGDYFANNMFQGCTNLTTLPDGFTLPQRATTTGREFLYQTFINLENLDFNENASFNLPQGLTTVGNNFMKEAFSKCSITKLPNGFTIPASITTIGTGFFDSAFYICDGLETLPENFVLPQYITAETDPNTCYNEMFYKCEKLQGTIGEIIGENAEPTSLRNTFFNCYTMTDYNYREDTPKHYGYCATNWGGQQAPQGSFTFTINANAGQTFKLPDLNRTTETNYWLVWWGDGTETFEKIEANTTEQHTHTYTDTGSYNISIVRANSEGLFDPEATKWLSRFSFNQSASAGMLTNVLSPLTWQMVRSAIDTPSTEEFFAMFSGCYNLVLSSWGELNLPQNITAVGNRFCQSMFAGCSALTTLPATFNLPQNITSTGENFLAGMFSGCGLTHLPADFKLPVINPAETRAKGVFAETFNGCSALTGYIAKIVGENEEPATQTHTFAGCTALTDYVPYLTKNWVEGQHFSFTIRATNTGKTFYLPDVANTIKTNYWLVNWGDGSAEEFCTISANSVDNKSHTYSTAGDYTIKIRPANSSGELDPQATAWATRFSFWANNYENPSKNMLITLNSPLTWQMTRSTIDGCFSSEYYAMFNACVNLNFANDSLFNLPQDITKTHDYYMANMFANCTSLTTLPARFNLPRRINTIGNYFVSSMFNGCTALITLPTGFTFPQGIKTAGDYFAKSMFYNCTALTTLSTGFRMPESLTSAGIEFGFTMFEGCRALTTLPATFNLPQQLTTVGDRFLQRFLSNCSSFTTFPVGFNLPQRITTIGANFLCATFQSNPALTTLPSSFKFPVINPASSRPTNCFGSTFIGCSALTSSIANVISTNQAPAVSMKTFSGCTRMSDYSTYQNTNWVQ